jgi:hypothetical protein
VPGFETASEVFVFGPAGTSFLVPIRVTIPFVGDPTGKVIYLSARDGDGFEPVPTEVGAGEMVAFITHFSRAFVGEDASEACADVECGSSEGGAWIIAITMSPPFFWACAGPAPVRTSNADIARVR